MDLLYFATLGAKVTKGCGRDCGGKEERRGMSKTLSTSLIQNKYRKILGLRQGEE